MSKHLIDPLGSFEKIKANFIKYYQTAFSTSFQEVEQEKEKLLNTDKVVSREPWVEPIIAYKNSNKRIADLDAKDLPGLTVDQISFFSEFINSGLFSDPEITLHHHQKQMLTSALSGENCVITSGTGSGKTESFLLPLFAQLTKELLSWESQTGKTSESQTYWQPDSKVSNSEIVDKVNGRLNKKFQQRGHETRKAAVRALIIYPMNALVEDQMTRLRLALDSKKVERFLKENGNNRIYFGRYNGQTPVAGKLWKLSEKTGEKVLNGSKIEQLKSSLLQIEENQKIVERHIVDENLTEKEAEELKSFFPKLNGAEMRSRFDMQASPPDILITNYSMLSIMMMRNIDSSIIRKTREWHHCEGEDEIGLPTNEKERLKENRKFHLIIDELHLYRGTAGTEVAYLVRLLLDKLGLHPDHKQLRILASSASLEPGDVDSQTFLTDFFGTSKGFQIIEGEKEKTSRGKFLEDFLPAEPFIYLARFLDDNLSAFDDSKLSGEASNFCQQIAEDISKSMGLDIKFDEFKNGRLNLLNLFNDERLRLSERILQVFPEEKPSVAVPNFFENNEGLSVAEGLFGPNLTKVSYFQALRGFFIIRGLHDFVDENGKRFTTNLPRFRFHFFFRNIEGIWSTIQKPTKERTVGKLHSTSRLIDNESGKNKVLELLYCESCGTPFYGGKKLIIKDGSDGRLIEMLPNSPILEGIPEKSTQLIPEGRPYTDYAIFWPKGSQTEDVESVRDLIPTYRIGAKLEVEKEISGKWVAARINCVSGDVFLEHSASSETNEINGYLFRIASIDNWQVKCEEEEEEIESAYKSIASLPCVCPRCGTDRSMGLRKTPIRGFRTGFNRISQVFAKELFYQLPEEKRKLVAFTDSRQDAADLANDLEREQYGTLLRDLIVELKRKAFKKLEVIKALERGDDAVYEEIDGNPRLEEVYKSFRKCSDRIKNIKEEGLREVNKIKELTVDVSDLAPDEGDTGEFIDDLRSLGVNPAGNDWEVQQFLQDNQYRNWWEVFEFDESNRLVWKPESISSEFKDELRKKIFENLTSVFFGRLFYGLEASGLGYLTTDYRDVPAEGIGGLSREKFVQVCDSFIRLLGEKYRTNKSSFNSGEYDNITRFSVANIIRKFINRVEKKYAIHKDSLGDTLIGYLNQKQHNGAILRIERLKIRFVEEETGVFECSNCRKIHLHHSVGVCTFCQNDLPDIPSYKAHNLIKNNYLTVNLAENRPPIRLHCEELTGQTDDQFSRQRHFRDVIFEKSEGPKEIKAIDILSVTTTLEVGVDIGSLQAVMLANMPPQRFNYQQRVGRGGRRGQSYSLVLTICRSRSHDDYYFAHPHRITGDPPPTPFLSIGQKEIVQRMLAKAILQEAFFDIDIPDAELEMKGILGVHGEFGLKENWELRRDKLSSWIKDNQSRINEIINSLRENPNNWLGWAKEGLLSEIDAAVNNEEISSIELSEALSEAGILPMFGMPSRVKVLYHTVSSEGKKLSLEEIDRSSDMAITEFAPGAQKTKDKKVHIAIGFTSPLILNKNRLWQTKESTSPFAWKYDALKCNGCGFFKVLNEGDEDPENCPNCALPIDDSNPFSPALTTIVAPKAYRTSLLPGSNEKDKTFLTFKRPTLFVGNLSNGDAREKSNLNATYQLFNQDQTWRIGSEIEGKLVKTEMRFPYTQKELEVKNQWIAKEFIEKKERVNGGSNSGSFSLKLRQQGFDSGENDYSKVSLADRKVTGVFRVFPNEVPHGLSLDSTLGEINNPSSLGVKGAFYSAAFILQRVLADELDVDPTEIEIAELTTKEISSNRRTGVITLSDELPNGSGFVRELFEQFITLSSTGVLESNSFLGKILNTQTTSQKYVKNMLSKSHRLFCQDACYECLKVFRNMHYHGILDWRLGITLLRMIGSDYKNGREYCVGIDGNFNYPELEDWLDEVRSIRDNFVASFEGFSPVDNIVLSSWGNKSFPALKNRGRIILIVHPFWDYKNPHFGLAEAVALANDMGNDTPLFIDTFNLSRRAGWCYEHLVGGENELSL